MPVWEVKLEGKLCLFMFHQIDESDDHGLHGIIETSFKHTKSQAPDLKFYCCFNCLFRCFCPSEITGSMLGDKMSNIKF